MNFQEEFIERIILSTEKTINQKGGLSYDEAKVLLNTAKELFNLCVSEKYNKYNEN